jgi:hypothetical protein
MDRDTTSRTNRTVLGLAGVFYPPIGLMLTVAIAALEAPILARIVGGPRPWLVSLAANLFSAAAGFGVVLWVALRDVTGAPPLWRVSPSAGDALFFAVMFGLSVVIEWVVVYLCWRKRGARRVTLGVLAANVVSYALLVPIMYGSQRW